MNKLDDPRFHSIGNDLSYDVPIYPTPMTQDDILDAGGEIIPDSVDLFDSNNIMILSINSVSQSNFFAACTKQLYPFIG